MLLTHFSPHLIVQIPLSVNGQLGDLKNLTARNSIHFTPFYNSVMGSEMTFDSEYEARKYKASMERGPYKVRIVPGQKLYDPIKGCVIRKFKAIVYPYLFNSH